MDNIRCPNCEHLRLELGQYRRDAELLQWVLPIVTGEDSKEADKRAMLIAHKLIIGLDGRDAISAAFNAEQANKHTTK